MTGMEERDMDVNLGASADVSLAALSPLDDSATNRSVVEEIDLVMRVMLSFCVIACIALAIIVVMLVYFDIENHSERYLGDYPLARYVPQVLYSAIPVFLGTVLEPVVEALNEFEMHPTAATAEDALIIKHFAVQFFNR